MKDLPTSSYSQVDKLASLFLSSLIASFVIVFTILISKILTFSFVYGSNKQSLDSFQRSDAEVERFACAQDWLPGSKTDLLS